MAEIAPKAIQLPDDQGVAGLKGFHAGIKPWPMILPPGRSILIDTVKTDTSLNQRIALQIEKLAPVRFRHPCIADEHGNSPRQNR